MFSGIESPGLFSPHFMRLELFLRGIKGKFLAMKKIVFAFSLAILSSVFAFAQSSTDYKKGEFFVGYSNGQVDTGVRSNSGNSIRNFFDDRVSFNGFEASGVYNIARHFGIKGDVSGTYKRENFSNTFA